MVGLGDGFSCCDVQLFKRHHKLIATETRDSFGLGHAAGNAVGDFDQKQKSAK